MKTTLENMLSELVRIEKAANDKGYKCDAEAHIAASGLWNPFHIGLSIRSHQDDPDLRDTQYIAEYTRHPDGEVVGADFARAIDTCLARIADLKDPAEQKRRAVHKRLADLLEEARDMSLTDEGFTEGAVVVELMEKAMKKLSHNILEAPKSQVAAE